jgi:hypothetical protein
VFPPRCGSKEGSSSSIWIQECPRGPSRDWRISDGHDRYRPAQAHPHRGRDRRRRPGARRAAGACHQPSRCRSCWSGPSVSMAVIGCGDRACRRPRLAARAAVPCGWRDRGRHPGHLRWRVPLLGTDGQTTTTPTTPNRWRSRRCGHPNSCRCGSGTTRRCWGCWHGATPSSPGLQHDRRPTSFGSCPVSQPEARRGPACDANRSRRKTGRASLTSPETHTNERSAPAAVPCAPTPQTPIRRADAARIPCRWTPPR